MKGEMLVDFLLLFLLLLLPLATGKDTRIVFAAVIEYGKAKAACYRL